MKTRFWSRLPRDLSLFFLLKEKGSWWIAADTFEPEGKGGVCLVMDDTDPRNTRPFSFPDWESARDHLRWLQSVYEIRIRIGALVPPKEDPLEVPVPDSAFTLQAIPKIFLEKFVGRLGKESYHAIAVQRFGDRDGRLLYYGLVGKFSGEWYLLVAEDSGDLLYDNWVSAHNALHSLSELYGLRIEGEEKVVPESTPSSVAELPEEKEEQLDPQLAREINQIVLDKDLAYLNVLKRRAEVCACAGCRWDYEQAKKKLSLPATTR